MVSFFQINPEPPLAAVIVAVEDINGGLDEELKVQKLVATFIPVIVTPAGTVYVTEDF